MMRVFDEPARATLSPRLVPLEMIKNVTSLNSTAYNLARIIGPAVAGILIAATSTAWCFFINGASFAAVLIALWLMRTEEIYPRQSAPRAPGQIKEGFKYILSTTLIRDMLLMMTIVGMLTYEFPTSLTAFTQAVLHGDAHIYAGLFSAMGIGALIGALFSAGKHHTSERDVMIMTFGLGISVTAASFTSTPFLAMLALVIAGFFSTNFLALINSMAQTECAPEMRGRVASIRIMAMAGTTVIGAPIIGFVAEYFGGRYGLMVSGISAIVAGILFVYLRRASAK
jgi:predicted MFS family arabinose efflux permease